jgi:hypothetical protein
MPSTFPATHRETGEDRAVWGLRINLRHIAMTPNATRLSLYFNVQKMAR